MNQPTSNEQQDFSGLGIAPNLMEILEKLSFKTPTPIQRQAIPVGIQGKDLVGVAQTGTGKTLAFGIPVIQRLNQEAGVAVIVLPTRELATQVDETIAKLGSKLGIKTAVLIGGMSIRPQISALARHPRVIIATPGRLNDHLQQGTVKLNDVTMVVLDEADRMLDMGFAPQIKRIFQHLPAKRQTLLFSATLAPEIMKMATSFMKLPIRIEVAPAGTIAKRLTQQIFIIPKEDKMRLVDKLLQQYTGPTLIFTKTKHGAKKLTRDIKVMGHSVVELHSNRSVGQRKEAVAGFKSGRYRILVATDIASRGIDVVGIELVLNFDMPTNSEDYVHRIGRTARAGGAGHAISLVTPDQRRDLRGIERLIRQSLPISPIPELPPRRPGAPAEVEDDRPRQFGRGGGRGPSRGGFGGSRGGFGGARGPSRGPSRGLSQGRDFGGDRPDRQNSSRPFNRRSNDEPGERRASGFPPPVRPTFSAHGGSNRGRVGGGQARGPSRGPSRGSSRGGSSGRSNFNRPGRSF